MFTKNHMSMLMVALMVLLSACDTLDSNDPSVASLEGIPSAANQSFSVQQASGVVYTMSNAAEGNEILAYGRAADGRLVAGRSFATGGLGSGDGLNGTSNPLSLSDDRNYLFAVNAGSNSLSVFRRNGRNLDLQGTVSSGGERPVSVAAHGNLVYVLNVGGTNPGNITGFRMNGGQLQHLVTRPVGAGNVDLPQIDFSPDGRFLVITDKPSNTITTYVVDGNGVAGQPNTQASSGQTPFGFDITPNNILLVSEAFGGGADASATSSYRIRPDGSLQVISAAVPTTETAACWADATDNGRFVYVTNTGSSTISGYAVGQGGALSLLDADGETAFTGEGSRPIDLEIIGNAYLYVHSRGTNELRGFAIDQNTGALTAIDAGIATGLPSTAVGVAAF